MATNQSQAYTAIMGGAGAKGPAHVGAIQACMEHGVKFDELIGTSAGAIMALLYLLDASSATMLDAVTRSPGSPNFLDTIPEQSITVADLQDSLLGRVLQDYDIPVLPKGIEEPIELAILRAMRRSRRFRSSFSLLERNGLFAGDDFTRWIESTLEERGKSRHALMGNFPGLTIIAYNLTSQNVLVLNAQNSPDLPVANAVRMSMSIPFIWKPVYWNSAWGDYSGRDISGHEIIDGGIQMNFAIHLSPRQRERLIGFYIDTEIGEDPPSPSEQFRGFEGLTSVPLLDYIGSVLDVMNREDQARIDHFDDVICRLPARGYHTLEFDLSGKRLGFLVDAGREAMKAHLERRQIPREA